MATLARERAHAPGASARSGWVILVPIGVALWRAPSARAVFALFSRECLPGALGEPAPQLIAVQPERPGGARDVTLVFRERRFDLLIGGCARGRRRADRFGASGGDQRA